MAEQSKIEWTTHTGNLWHGCTHAGIGCLHCYAEVLSKRWGRDIWGNDKPRMAIKSVWNDFKRYQKMAADAGEIHRVFVGSMMDIFEKPMPVVDSKGNKIMLDDMDEEGMNTGDMRNQFFNLVVPACPNLMFLLLTKRPSNINRYIPDSWKENPPANVMFGTSPVNQQTADKLIPQLLQVKGRHFLSVEPQLGEIVLDNRYLKEWCPEHDMPSGGCTHSQHKDKSMFTKIDWVICGGESGGHKRPFDAAWARLIRDQCKEAGTPFFMKQIDKVQEIPKDLEIKQYPPILKRIFSLRELI